MAKLTLVGLPIGNAQDITKRAYAVLEKQKSFLVEDTRNFKSLLGHYGFSLSEYRLESFHDHNKENIDKLLMRLDGGEDLFLCSDAGSPVLSDPAYPLVKAAIEKDHEIDSIPGVSSPVVALELSGLPPQPFKFWGFLARKDQQKISWFNELSENQTHICFESPIRMKDTIELFYKESERLNISNKVKIVITRELTKLYQEAARMKLSNWPEVADQLTFRGEMVLLIYKDSSNDKKVGQSRDKLMELANDYLKKQSPRKLAKLLSGILGGKPGEYYELLSKHDK